MHNPDKNTELKIEAMQRAQSYVNAIKTSKTDPKAKVEGEALRIYNELEEWNWFERYPIEDEKNEWMYLAMVAMTQYRHLKWQSEHPVKPKKSKWEVVMGRKRETAI